MPYFLKTGYLTNSSIAVTKLQLFQKKTAFITCGFQINCCKNHLVENFLIQCFCLRNHIMQHFC
jgi:hypothetical protein